MRTYGGVMLAALAMGSWAGYAADQPKGMVVIDGAKEPGQIPEWVAWEASFGLVQLGHGKESAFTHDLRYGAPEKGQVALRPTEWALLDAEGQRFSRLELVRAETARALQAKYGNPDWTDPQVVAKVDPKVLAQADADSWATDLQYRRGILAARDRLLAAFSDESRILLLNWVEENKASIVTTIPAGDLPRYRQPE